MVSIRITLSKPRVAIGNANEHKACRPRISSEGRSHIECVCSSFNRCSSRMLLVTKSHHEQDDILPDRENTRRMSLCKESVSPWTGASQFLATTNKIIQFSNGREAKVRPLVFMQPTVASSRLAW